MGGMVLGDFWPDLSVHHYVRFGRVLVTRAKSYADSASLHVMSLSISFISDFGHRDESVGVVHGVIATIDPEIRIVDIGHGIDRGDIRSGALSLLRAIQYLPKGVALAVVDPGVGTTRAAIVVETEWGLFVGPDNGLLAPAVAMTGGASRVHAITNPELIIPSQGATFAGRDVFAPTAAALASGQAKLEEVGDGIDPNTLMPMVLPLPEVETDFVRGATWWVDHFGNVQTNISPEDMALLGLAPGSIAEVEIGSRRHEIPFVSTYGAVCEGKSLLLVDSHGLIALCVNGGRADENYNLGTDRPFTVRPVS